MEYEDIDGLLIGFGGTGLPLGGGTVGEERGGTLGLGVLPNDETFGGMEGTLFDGIGGGLESLVLPIGRGGGMPPEGTVNSGIGGGVLMGGRD